MARKNEASAAELARIRNARRATRDRREKPPAQVEAERRLLALFAEMIRTAEEYGGGCGYLCASMVTLDGGRRSISICNGHEDRGTDREIFYCSALDGR